MSSFYIWRNCFSGEISGGDIHTGGLCTWLFDHGEEITLIHAKGDGQNSVYPENQRIHTVEYTEPKFIKKILPVMLLVRGLLGARVKIDFSGASILVAGSHFFGDVFPVYTIGRTNREITTAVYVHHIIQDMPRPKNLNTLMANIQEKICLRLIKSRFDKIMTSNAEVKQRLIDMGFTQDILVTSNFAVIPNDLVRSKERNIDLVFCGRFVPQKGIYDFVDVCERLSKKYKDFNAVMIGVGPEYTKVSKLIDDNSVPVKLLGRVPDTIKYDSLQSAKMFLFPSIEEGWGIAIAEALNMGTPVVAYDLPVYKTIFNDLIIKVPISDTAKLYGMACKLLDKFEDSTTTYAIESERLRNESKIYSVDSVIAGEYEFLTEMKHN